MNSDVLNFFKRNDIDIYRMDQIDGTYLYSEEEINEISARYGFRKRGKKEAISIADIVGYDTSFREIPKNILESVEHFFDSQGDGYHFRSVGMLEYTKDDVIEKLQDSFKSEPIEVDDTGEGKYVVSTNGLHRYTVLRILYLSECEKAKGDEEKLRALREKYKIPVIVHELDKVKTYCKFILMNYGVGVKSVKSEFNKDYNYTGNVVVENFDGTTLILNDSDLIDFVKEKCPNFGENLAKIQRQYDKYSSLKEFIDGNLTKQKGEDISVRGEA